jgi:hypothetical protein
MGFWGRKEIEHVIEFFATCWQAERLLARVLSDEPDSREILRVETVVFPTGTAN